VNSAHWRAASRPARIGGVGFSAILAVGRCPALHWVWSGAKACSLGPPILAKEGWNTLASESLGPGPGPALKKLLNVNTLIVWTASPLATNGSAQIRTDVRSLTLFPPLMPSVANAVIDFPQPACRHGAALCQDRRAPDLRANLVDYAIRLLVRFHAGWNDRHDSTPSGPEPGLRTDDCRGSTAQDGNK
jgi:hypothetical protein